MTTKKTVSFDDTDGNTYELIIDSKKLPKGLYSAINPSCGLEISEKARKIG
ncbi:hypothetical protein [Wolbachia endosymbiont (group B) of Eupithecia inturbata]|uniref:hypothetical protein n=1 Tax=Wolbachia endosymbiont (group B) of Eupithecia inturbata TaxID=3139316 RepID=UPI003CCB4BC9